MRNFLPFLLALCLVAPALGQTPGTVQYPTSLDTPSTLFETTDNAATVLTLSLTSSATTANVTSTTKFPSTGSLVIGSEVIFYTGKTGTSFTGLLRGRSGTTAAAHASGAQVRSPVLAAHHNAQSSAVIAVEGKVGAGASAPAAGKVLVGTGDGVSEWQAAPAINCINCTGITGASGGVNNAGSTTIGADNDANGTGVVDIQTRNTTRLRVTNGGVVEVYAPLQLPRYATPDLPTGGEAFFAYDTTVQEPVYFDGTTWKAASSAVVSTYTAAEMAALPAPPAGLVINLSDDVRGEWRHNGSKWTKGEPCVNPIDFLVLNDGTAQSATNFQAAIDAAYLTVTGYNEVCARGNFKFNSGALVVKDGVSLVGNWRGDPSHSGALDTGFNQPNPANTRGTTFQIDTGSGTATGCFVTAHANATVRGISFYWPSQSQTAVTPTAYPWAVCARGETYTGFNQRFEDLEMVNAYQGLSLMYGGRWTVRNVTGQFLKTGLDVDYMFDKSEVYNFKNSLLWSSPYTATVANRNPFYWMNQNGTGIRVGKVDALTIVAPFIFGSNKGIEFHSSPPTTLAGNALPGGVAWAEVIGGGVGDEGATGFHFAGSAAAVGALPYQATVKIIGTDIVAMRNSGGGSTYGMYFASDYLGAVSVLGAHVCRLTATFCVYNVGAPTLNIASSTFTDWGTAAIFSNLPAVTTVPATINLSNNNFLRAQVPTPLLTLDLRGYVVGTSTGDLYPAVEASAVNNTSAFSFFLNGVRMGDGNLTTGLAGSGAKYKVTATGNLLVGPASEAATNATSGLLYIPTMNGAPTGAPAAATGFVPFTFDRANKKLCVYTGGAWSCSAAFTP